MKLYYWQSRYGNFGDEMNHWLWDFLLPGFREVHPDVLLIGVGTVLNRELLPSAARKLVVGSGLGYGTPPDISAAQGWDLRCVRGPLTAERLGLDPECGVIDPAVMVSEMPEFQNLPKTIEALFVPHWRSAVNGAWSVAAEAAGLTFISPCEDAKTVVRAIAQARLVVAESMHAAIIADALRVPWIPVKSSRDINDFKWRDWAASVGLQYEPQRLPLTTSTEARAKGVRFWGMRPRATAVREVNVTGVAADGTAVLTSSLPHAVSPRMVARRLLATPAMLGLWRASRARPRLSDDSVLAERKERLWEIVAGIRRDYL